MKNRYFLRGFGLKKEVVQELKNDYYSPIIDIIKLSDYQLTLGNTTIKLAKEFGFCYGVDRSIEFAYQTVKKFPNRKIYLVGEIIHNPFVNNRLLEMGIQFISGRYKKNKKIEDIKPDDIVILPAFGVTVSLLERLKKLNCILVDTTCGSVFNVWKNVENFTRDGFTALVHGKYSHEETIATVSRATLRKPGNYLIVRNEEEAQILCDYIRKPKDKQKFLAHFKNAISNGFDPDKHLVKIGIANQTTMLAEESLKIAGMIKSALSDRYGAEDIKNHFRSFDTICRATQDRQDAIIKLLETTVDLTIIIGGYNSSNTNNLSNIAAKYSPTYHIEDADCIKNTTYIEHQPAGEKNVTVSTNWLPEGKVIIAITAGASTPNKKIGEVIEKLFQIRGEKLDFNQNPLRKDAKIKKLV
jgi:4-hydroxy-3-methylbut-2-enyl diphosphate reductase